MTTAHVLLDGVSVPLAYQQAFADGCGDPGAVMRRNPEGGLQFDTGGETFGLVMNEHTRVADAFELGRDAAKKLSGNL